MSNNKENSGILFNNKNKKEDKHPAYTGTATINGVAYELASWIKEGKAGKFMTISFKVKESTPNPSNENTDDLPF
jgi:hypothetical protein